MKRQWAAVVGGLAHGVGSCGGGSGTGFRSRNVHCGRVGSVRDH